MQKGRSIGWPSFRRDTGKGRGCAKWMLLGRGWQELPEHRARSKSWQDYCGRHLQSSEGVTKADNQKAKENLRNTSENLRKPKIALVIVPQLFGVPIHARPNAAWRKGPVSLDVVEKMSAHETRKFVFC